MLGDKDVQCHVLLVFPLIRHIAHILDLPIHTKNNCNVLTKLIVKWWWRCLEALSSYSNSSENNFLINSE